MKIWSKARVVKIASLALAFLLVATVSTLPLTHLRVFGYRFDHMDGHVVYAQYTQGLQWQTNDNVAAIEIGAAGGCQGFLTTGVFAAGPGNSGAFAGPTFVRAAANNDLWQATTSAAASALTLDCDLSAPFTRTTPGKGVIVTGAAVEYGVQTSALTSVTLPTVATVTYPAFGGTAQGTVAAAGGVITTSPAIGSAQLTTTTTGQCFNQQVILTAPIPLNAQNQRLVMEEVFNQTVAAATTYQICGVQVFYQNVVF